MTTPETPLNTEKNTRDRQIQEDEDYLNVKNLPKTKKKSRKGKFMPKVIREGKSVSKPKKEEDHVKKAKKNAVRKANDKPVHRPKGKPVRKFKWLNKKKEKHKPNINVEMTSNKRKARGEPVRRNLNFDEFELSSGSSEITVNEHGHFDSSENSCVLFWNADETSAGNFPSFPKKRRTMVAKKEYKKDWSVIKWFTDEPQTNDYLSSECKIPVIKKKRTRITKRECSKAETDSTSNSVPHFKKRRKPSQKDYRNGWKNYRRLSSGGFTFETLKEYMPLSDKVGKEKHPKVDGYIVYSRRHKFSTCNAPAKLYNVDTIEPPTPQKVSMCKVNEQSKILELEDSKCVLESRTTETQSSIQPSFFEYGLGCSENFDFGVSECIALDENKMVTDILGEVNCTPKYEIPEPEASNVRTGNRGKADVCYQPPASNVQTGNRGKADVCYQPPTPGKLVGHNLNRNSLSKFGPVARVELILDKQLELKGKTRAVKKRVSRLDFALSNSSHMMDLHEGKHIPIAYKRKQQISKKDILDLTRRLKYLKLDVGHESSIVPYSSGHRSLVSLHTKKHKGKIDLDPESNRVWELLMTQGVNYETSDTDREKEEWWEEQRSALYQRIESFIVNMELILGDRKFSPWNGSVVDSIIGVYLTQNVSDVLSSSAFMNLAATFPLHPKCTDRTANVERTSDPETVEGVKSEKMMPQSSSSSTDAPMCQVINDSVTVVEIEDRTEKHSYSEEGDYLYAQNTSSYECGLSDIPDKRELGQSSICLTFQDLNKTDNLNFNEECKLQKISKDYLDNVNVGNEVEEVKAVYDYNLEQTCKKLSIHGTGGLAGEVDNVAEQTNIFLGLQDSNNIDNVISYEACYSQNVPDDHLISSSGVSGNNFEKMNDLNSLEQVCQVNSSFEQSESTAVCQVDSMDEQNRTCLESNNLKSGKNNNLQKDSDMTSNNASKVKVVKKETNKTYDWDSLRKQAFENGARKERCSNALDSLDYEAVRRADQDMVAAAIKERGQNNILARNIKNFLDRTVNIHGSVDLEWLRKVPPEKAKEYLLTVNGLGIKSVECVRLLTLHHQAFPVDTNVGRICVRLGWVPLQPLPESVQLHLLELYPVQETIQKYLWPRLCKLDHGTLYKLHYLLIAAGKVFCTKRKPNCNACPMRGECKHFASAFASSRLALPGPDDTYLVGHPITSQNYPVPNSMPLPLVQLSRNVLPPNQNTEKCVPIIEEPASPQPTYEEYTEKDIEDYCLDGSDDDDDDDGIPTIKLNMEEFTCNLKNCMKEMNIKEETSQALVSLTPEAASIPVPKLKNVHRLRTIHAAYEIEDDTCPILEGFEKRVPDDPCRYVLVIWSPGETSQSTDTPEDCCNVGDSMCNMATCFRCNGKREAQAGTVRGTILIPCRTANRGSFPLNGTYFQVNEVFADHYTSHHPLNVPTRLLWSLRKVPVYIGTSVTTMLRGLTTAEIQMCFWKGYICVRAYDRETRRPEILSPRLHLNATVAANKKKERNQRKGRRSKKIRKEINKNVKSAAVIM